MYLSAHYEQLLQMAYNVKKTAQTIIEFGSHILCDDSIKNILYSTQWPT
jgi:hypothetical protein